MINGLALTDRRSWHYMSSGVASCNRRISPTVLENPMPVIKVFSPSGGHLAAAVMGAMVVGLSEPVPEIPSRMPRGKTEKTRRGNPNQLTCKQHVFPARSIERFAGEDGRVSVHDLRTGRDWRPKPRDNLFCARRAWDQRAETGYMKGIEDGFQTVADAVIKGQTSLSTPEQKQAVEAMFALWYMRGRYRELAAQEIKLNGIAGDCLTKEQEENLEVKGYLFARSGGQMPARQLNGLWLQRRIDGFRSDLSSIDRWGVIAPESGEFIVADVPSHGIMPLTPKLALVASSPDGMISVENLALINRASMADSQQYFFARDLSECPQ